MPAGFLVIISAPSGTGKSTVCRKLLERDRSLQYSISATTRKPRSGEIHGKHYFFLSMSEFERRVRRGEMLEWAKVHGNYYGTPWSYIDRRVRMGDVVVLAIDVQGAASIRSRRHDAVTVFLLPPSWQSLRERLRNRKDSSDSIDTRLRNARKELRHAKEYDYWVLNDSLPTAVKQVESIILTEKLKAHRQNPAMVSVLARAAV